MVQSGVCPECGEVVFERGRSRAILVGEDSEAGAPTSEDKQCLAK